MSLYYDAASARERAQTVTPLTGRLKRTRARTYKKRAQSHALYPELRNIIIITIMIHY